MKTSVLAVAAAIAIANAAADSQPALRSEATPEEAAPGAVKTPDGNNKEMFWGGGPWGWGGGWGGPGWGGPGWGGGWGGGWGW